MVAVDGMLVKLRVDMEDRGGRLELLLPYATLEPIRDVLYSSTQGDSAEPDRRWVNLLKQQIQSAEVDLVAELGTAPATVEQLLSFKPGDFIELDLKPDIQAKVAGVPILACHYGTANGTATAGSDYSARSGTLASHSGIKSGTINAEALRAQSIFSKIVWEAIGII